jgi:hypothetical protein
MMLANAFDNATPACWRTRPHIDLAALAATGSPIAYAREVNPGVTVLPASARSGEGRDAQHDRAARSHADLSGGAAVPGGGLCRR